MHNARLQALRYEGCSSGGDLHRLRRTHGLGRGEHPPLANGAVGCGNEVYTDVPRWFRPCSFPSVGIIGAWTDDLA